LYLLSSDWQCSRQVAEYQQYQDATVEEAEDYDEEEVPEEGVEGAV
jgi:hypothetical protein